MKGYHLMIDVNIEKNEKLEDINEIYKFLNDIVFIINMTPISTPYIVKYDGNGKKNEWGLSGFILIAESHISIHTYPDKKYFSMDVYSCKEFKENNVIKFVEKVFNECSIISKFIIRGYE